MGAKPDLKDEWRACRQRLAERNLLTADNASLSLRCPGNDMMWFGEAGDIQPRQAAWSYADNSYPAKVHAAIFQLRQDVGAIASGGGFFAARLADFGGTLPQLFDEQARYLGTMAEPVEDIAALARPLRHGGNVIFVRRTVFCFGTSATRMMQNVELFEKCATAYVLATAAGGKVKPLPWIVRRIANGRLRKEQSAAAERIAAGLPPEESRGY